MADDLRWACLAGMLFLVSCHESDWCEPRKYGPGEVGCPWQTKNAQCLCEKYKAERQAKGIEP